MTTMNVSVHLDEGDRPVLLPAVDLAKGRVAVAAMLGGGEEVTFFGIPDQLEKLARGILESIGRPVPTVRATLDLIETEAELTEALTALQGALRRLRGGDDGPPNTETGSPLDLSDVITLTDAGEHALAGRPSSLDG